MKSIQKAVHLKTKLMLAGKVAIAQTPSTTVDSLAKAISPSG